MSIDPNNDMEINEHARFNEIFGIILSALSVFGFLSLFIPSRTGPVGIAINYGLTLSLGYGAFIVPLFVLGLGVSLLFNWKPSYPAMRFAGFIIIFIDLLIILDIIIPSEVLTTPASGGGVAGGFITTILLTAFGRLGTYVLMAAFFMIGTILLFDLPMAIIVSRVFIGAINLVKIMFIKIGSQVSNVKNLYKEMRDNLFPYSDLDLPPEAFRDDEEEDEGRPYQTDYGKEAAQETAAHKEELKKPAKKASRKPANSYAQKREEEPKRISLTEEDKKKGLPSVLMLDRSPRSTQSRRMMDKGDQRNDLEETFNNFGIKAKVLSVNKGPIITRYELQPAPGVKVSKILNLADDIALSLAAPDIRIEAPIPGKSAVGIEVPNKRSAMVTLREVLETDEFQEDKSCLSIGLGLDIAGNPVVGDLKKMLHVLIAGATGSGKSVCINGLICSLLFRATPEQLRLLIIDPKMVELTVYNGIPHLVTPVVTDAKKAAMALGWAVSEMERRYKLFSELHVRNIESYNEKVTRIHEEEEQKAKEKENEDKEEVEDENNEGKKGKGEEVDETASDSQSRKYERFPYLVVIIDELADLMMVAPGDVEDAICRLAQMARAAGIHLVIATQRPSADVITGIIKANIPSRIAFAVSSMTDSRIILDIGGAERLIGKGDMLYYPTGSSKPTRIQGAYISDKEVETLVQYVKEHAEDNGDAEVEITKAAETGSSQSQDELFEDAAKIVLNMEQASISMLQRKLRVGYARAARIVDELESTGLIGPHEGSKPRTVLLSEEEWKERQSQEG